jgi:hypothetical protein
MRVCPRLPISKVEAVREGETNTEETSSASPSAYLHALYPPAIFTAVPNNQGPSNLGRRVGGELYHALDFRCRSMAARLRRVAMKMNGWQEVAVRNRRLYRRLRLSAGAVGRTVDDQLYVQEVANSFGVI